MKPKLSTLKKKPCKICKEKFQPFNSLTKVCSPKCALELVRIAETRKQMRELRERKEKLKTLSDHLKEAQTAFNAYIRERDKYEPCISCGRHHEGQYHAGHYKTVGANPELRFHPFNNNKQCAPCNNHLSGNIANYRPNLKKKIGEKNLEWLEGRHEAQHLTIDDAKEIKDYYKEQLKILKTKQKIKELE